MCVCLRRQNELRTQAIDISSITWPVHVERKIRIEQNSTLDPIGLDFYFFGVSFEFF